MYFMVPYDGGSNRSGSSNAHNTWSEIIPDAKFYKRSRGPLILEEVEQAVRFVGQNGGVPFTLGGDHTISFYCVRGLLSLHGKFSVLHFDAHHDQHPGPHLNNYTVLNYVSRMGAPVIGVGYRFEGHAPVQLQHEIEGPVYVSVDVDYFDPRLVRSVSFPVPVIEREIPNLETFKNSLSLIRGPVVGIDLLEWRGTEDPEERKFMFSVFNLLKRLKEKNERT